ncbi:MAG TPA: lytic murein transglycosylase [Candidatus Saccharimonadales bacterium]
MSQFDCDAVTYGWVDWAPYTGCDESASDSLAAGIPAAYSTIFNFAATQEKASVSLLAAIFYTENANYLKSFPTDNPVADTSWPISPTGAEGPFQFEPGTWSQYRTDGNGDAKTDVNNVWDAAYSSANYLAALGATSGTSLGGTGLVVINGQIDNSSSVIQKHTLLWAAASYNDGEGNVDESNGRVSALAGQTQSYIDNVYALINSGFKTVGTGFPAIKDGTNGATITKLPPNVSGTNVVSTSDTASNSSCGSGNSSITQEAVALAWPEQYQDAEKAGILCSQKQTSTCEARTSPLTDTNAYATAIQKVSPDIYNDPIFYKGADCAAFVGTVMRFTKADPNYPPANTIAQGAYVKAHPDLYTIITSITSTADIKPGDILLIPVGLDGETGHTFIYTGVQQSNPYHYDDASASGGDRAPNMGMLAWSIGPSSLQDIELPGRGPYFIARPKNQLAV